MASRGPASVKVGGSDDEIVSRFQATGDHDYFAELVDRYGAKVHGKCRGFFKEEQAAKDAVQETFLLAFRRIQQYTAGNFQGWLLQIARNVCIDRWRKERMNSEFELLDSNKHFSPESSAETKSFVDQIWAALQTLPNLQRQCIELKIEGCSYEETAKLLGISIGDVKTYLQNGRRMLRNKFGD